VKRVSSISIIGTAVQDKRIERLSNSFWLLRIEIGLKTAFETAESVSGVRILLTDHIVGQLVIFHESHARSLSPERAA
jgi:hypothetical protein